MAQSTSKQPEERSDARFSARLESWLKQDESKTIGALTGLLGERRFALVLTVLLFPSAIPIPTGGVTHVLELVAALVALQLIAGRRELWLPRRVREHELGEIATAKALPAIIRFVRWFERWTRPRLAAVYSFVFGDVAPDLHIQVVPPYPERHASTGASG
jgi:hypothetical protein